MGYEIDCHGKFGDRESEGKALLETDSLIFRGRNLRFEIAFAEITALEARKGHLVITTNRGIAVLDLGEKAESWAARIRKPKSRIEKLGVRREQRVLLVGVEDAELRREIESAGASILDKSGQHPADVLFYAVHSNKELEILAELKKEIAPNGAIWILRPKGRKEITEANVMDAAKKAGLVDVKVVRFSETHTAEKLVIPLAKRGLA